MLSKSREWLVVNICQVLLRNLTIYDLLKIQAVVQDENLNFHRN